MKKLVTTLTAVAFALGLTTLGFSQTAGKETEKPKVTTETQVTQPQAASQEKGGSEVTGTTEATGPQKKGDKGKGLKTGQKTAKSEKESATPLEKPQVEEKKN